MIKQRTGEITGAEQFHKVFGAYPTHVAEAPGRVNLIGEHIDYCGGLVMPMTIKQRTCGWYRFTGRTEVRVFSDRFDEARSFNPLDIRASAQDHWSDFVQGLLRLGVHRQLGRGFDLWLTSDLSSGGLSSSASFLALLAMINHHALTDRVVDENDTSFRLTLALLCQQVENDFVGVPSGVMDPVSIMIGGLIKLDCRTLKFEQLASIPETHCLVVMDCGVPRTLAASGYAERVKEIAHIEALNPSIVRSQCLAQVAPDIAETFLEQLTDPVLRSRAKHVFSEQSRVHRAGLALANQDLSSLGQLMNESHRSLAEDYEVSCDELDRITKISRDSGLSLGARMTGAGFGGCAISLLAKADVARHNEFLTKTYIAQTGIKPTLLVAESGAGASVTAL